MGSREQMLTAAEPYLMRGETVQVVFAGQTASPLVGAFGAMGGLLGALIVSAAGGNRTRIFVVTTSRILVLDASPWSLKRVTGVVADLPRSTQLGPPSGLWHKIPVNGKRIRVHRKTFERIREADRLAPSVSAGAASS